MTTAYSSSEIGLTLIEALAAIGVLAVLCGIAMPQMREIHERWQVTQVGHAMTNTLTLARSEAIKRGGGIGMRKIDQEKNGCQNAGTTREWGCGWFIYEDVDNNGSWNNKKDKLLHHVKLDGAVNVMRKSGGNNLQFDRYGMAGGLNANGFTLSPERQGILSSATQTLCMTSGGRIRMVDGEECPK